MIESPLHVVIAGGGVAALEAALALRELAGDRVAVTMLAPEPDFLYRPTGVLEPFSLGLPRRYPLAEIADNVGFRLRRDRFTWLDPQQRVVHTGSGEPVHYDALLLALGAVRHARFKHTLTLDDAALGEQLHGLVQDIEGGYIESIAFLIPERPPWPLPIYELALLASGRADEMNIDLSVTIVTPEQSPVASFGSAASGAVAQRLIENRIKVLTASTCEVRAPGQITINGSTRPLEADLLIALPELFGPSVPGVPLGPRGGFIPVDPHCRVKHLDRVFAAGDATDYPVKLGGVAAQQADVAAEAIASLAGAHVIPQPFRPVLDAVLLGGGPPLSLSNAPGRSQERTPRALRKIHARYLAPYLESRYPATLAG